MPLTLNTQSSIVDFLKSIGQDASYGNRQRIYQSLNLGDRLGDYVGSASQNTALLNQVRNLNSQGISNFTQRQPSYQPPPVSIPSGGQYSPYAPQSPYQPPQSPSQIAAGLNQQFGGQQSPAFQSQIPRGINLVGQAPQAPTPGASPGFTGFGAGTQFRTETGQAGIVGQSGTTQFTDVSGYNTHTVAPGDTLSQIAQTAGVSLQELLRLNPGFQSRPDSIFPGEKVLVPQLRGGAENRIAGAASEYLRGGYRDGDVVTHQGQKYSIKGNDLIPITGLEGLLGPQQAIVKGGTVEMSAFPGVNAFGQPVEAGTQAFDVLSYLGGNTPSVDEVISKINESPEYKILEERFNLTNQTAEAKAEATKQILDFKYGQNKDTLEQNLAANGLAFSGIRTEQVKALSDSLAMSKLGVDRDLAVALMDSNLDLKEDILKLATGVVKEAQQNRKEALQQLNAAGLALVGGVLVPTLSAQQYQLQQQRYALDFQLRLDQFEALQGQREEQNTMALQRLQIASQNAMTAQERNAILNQMREIQLLSLTAVSPGQIVNAASGLPAKLTADEKDRFAGYDSFLNAYIPQVETLLPKVQTGGAMGNYIKFAANKPLLQQTLTQDQNALMSAIAAMNNALVYLQSGKQINEQEFLRLSQAMPDLTLTNTQNNIRMGQFKTLMNEIYQSRLRASGFGISGQAVNGGLVGEISTFDDEYDDFDPFGLF